MQLARGIQHGVHENRDWDMLVFYK